MRDTKNIKVFNPLIAVLLLAAMIVPSCNPKATHLTQNLENSGVPGQRSTQTAGAATQKLGQETSHVHTPSSFFDPTATSIEPMTTQSPSVTPELVLTPTPSPIVLIHTATSKSTTPQYATSTLVPSQTRTSTPTLTVTATPTKTATLTLTPTLQTGTLVPSQTRTSTPTLTATATPTKTATFTLTPTLQTGWEGEWIIFIQLANGTYMSGTMNLALNGTDVIATAILDGVEYNFEGDNYAEGKQITGSWQTDSNNGYFWWMLVSDAQFGGSLDLQYGVCGARAGAEKPVPCFIEPPR